MAVNEGLRVNAALLLPASSLAVRFSRASGPGGQNVNKVETVVELIFDLFGTSALSERQRTRLRERLGTRLNSKGELVVRASSHREQSRNLAEARARMAALLAAALVPIKRRVATKPTRASGTRRLEHKRVRSAIKRNRGTEREDQ